MLGLYTNIYNIIVNKYKKKKKAVDINTSVENDSAFSSFFCKIVKKDQKCLFNTIRADITHEDEIILILVACLYTTVFILSKIHLKGFCKNNKYYFFHEVSQFLRVSGSWDVITDYLIRVTVSLDFLKCSFSLSYAICKFCPYE